MTSPVNEVPRTQVLHAGRDLRRDAQQLRHIHVDACVRGERIQGKRPSLRSSYTNAHRLTLCAAGLEHRTQIPVWQVLQQHDVRLADGDHTQQLQDVRVVERGQDACFRQEIVALSIGAVVAADFDCHVFALVRVKVCQEYLPCKGT